MRAIDADRLQKQFDEKSTNPNYRVNMHNIKSIISNAPTVEAIPKADYENRLKADMAAMLDEIQLQAEENIENIYEKDEDDLLQLAQHNAFADCFEQYNDLIQEKINELKAESENT